MEAIEPLASSFRDPAGFVFKQKDRFYRAVTHRHKVPYEKLMHSGLYASLIEKKLLLPHSEIYNSTVPDGSLYKVLLPEQIGFISYPYEWCFLQWKDIIISFLKINLIALEYGMILQDATPFNQTFYKGKPVFFDTLSFVPYNPGDPWNAYRQFCESMLAPLALIRYKGNNWIKQFSTHINGIDLAYASREMPLRTYLKSLVLLHIHLHSRYRSNKAIIKHTVSGLSAGKIQTLLQMLLTSIKKWKLSTGTDLSSWENYYQDQVISQQYLVEKIHIVERCFTDLQPIAVTDLGANNGRISMIAAGYASSVIAVESDPACVNELYRQIKNSGKDNIAVIQADLMQPSPGIGWNNEERVALFDRLSCDVLMGLALIHHLCIPNNVPLHFIAKLFVKLTTRFAIVEFVPRSDPKVQAMLHSRRDIFEDYHEETFISCFSKYFVLKQVYTFTVSDRKIFVWEKR